MAASQPVQVISVAQYSGQATIEVAATQLADSFSASQARRILDDWVRFLAAGPTPIRELRFVTRTPKRLFEALAAQTQLEGLHVKWGNYDDLSALSRLVQLRSLTLGGASSVRGLEPLRRLQNLISLEIDYLRHVHDLTPLADLAALRSLQVGGNWVSFVNLHLDSLAFLRSMPHSRSWCCTRPSLTTVITRLCWRCPRSEACASWRPGG